LRPTSPCISREQLSYPFASRPFGYGFASATFKVWTQSKAKKLFDDLALCAYRRIHARTASPGVLHRKVERSGAGFVPHSRISPGFEEISHGGRAPGSDRAVQRRSAILILQMNVGAAIDEATKRFDLSGRIPNVTTDAPIRRIMQWGAVTMVLRRVWVGADSQQLLNNLDTITGRSQMQRGIPGINPMENL